MPDDKEVVAGFEQLQFDWSAAARGEAVAARTDRPTVARVATGNGGASSACEPARNVDHNEPGLAVAILARCVAALLEADPEGTIDNRELNRLADE